MNNYKLSILFLLQKARINKQGKCPLRCRITYQEKRYEFSIGVLINPNLWNSKLQLVKPPNEENTNINNQLSLIKSKINQAFLFFKLKNKILMLLISIKFTKEKNQKQKRLY